MPQQQAFYYQRTDNFYYELQSYNLILHEYKKILFYLELTDL